MSSPIVTFSQVTPEDSVQARNQCGQDNINSDMKLSSDNGLHEQSQQCYLSEDRLTGFMVSGTGELVNLFMNEPKGQGSLAIQFAINQGGARHLHCFAGYFSRLFNRSGFKEVKRLTWDEYLKVAPANWDVANFDVETFGHPDIIFMELGKGKEALRIVDSPDKNLVVKNFRPFKRGTLLGKLEGQVLKELTQHSLAAWEDGRKLFIDDPIFGYTAHGCVPNVELKDGSIYALKDLWAGDLLYMDYSVSEETLFCQFKCCCGAPGCKGWITGYGEEQKGRIASL